MNRSEISRRKFLRAGGTGALSLGVPGLVIGKDKTDASGKAVASKKSCIFLLLCGGPSHLDTWDLKPNAPSEYRGPYSPIRTKVPGMQLSELHPKLAKVTDQFCLIRSMHHPGPISNHFDAMHNLLSGQYVERVQQGVPDGSPYIGSVVGKHLPSERNLVSNAWLIKCVGPPVFCAPNIGAGGYLGSAYAPVFVGSADNHPAMPNFKPPEIYDLADPARLQQRRKLLSSLESGVLANDPQGKDWGELREMAYDAMTRAEGREAFEMDREPASVRERYGMHPLGQNLLLARRMVEAGVRFVTVNGWTGPAPGAGEGPPSSSWDMHGGHMGMGNAFGSGSYGMGWCLPRLDEAPLRAADRSKGTWPAGRYAGRRHGRIRALPENPDQGASRSGALATVFLRDYGRLRDSRRRRLRRVGQDRRFTREQSRNTSGSPRHRSSRIGRALARPHPEHRHLRSPVFHGQAGTGAVRVTKTAQFS
jgi:hypothetical protein